MNVHINAGKIANFRGGRTVQNSEVNTLNNRVHYPPCYSVLRAKLYTLEIIMQAAEYRKHHELRFDQRLVFRYGGLSGRTIQHGLLVRNRGDHATDMAITQIQSLIRPKVREKAARRSRRNGRTRPYCGKTKQWRSFH